jgi:hypothetical protein
MLNDLGNSEEVITTIPAERLFSTNAGKQLARGD